MTAEPTKPAPPPAIALTDSDLVNLEMQLHAQLDMRGPGAAVHMPLPVLLAIIKLAIEGARKPNTDQIIAAAKRAKDTPPPTPPTLQAPAGASSASSASSASKPKRTRKPPRADA